MSPNRPPRCGNVYLWASLALFAAFAALAAGMWLAIQTRFISDEQLLRELADAEFIEDPPPAKAEWPQWRGARRDGVAFCGPLLTAWPRSGPPELWNKD